MKLARTHHTRIGLSLDIEEILAFPSARPIFSSHTFRRLIDQELLVKEIPGRIRISQDDFPALDLKEFSVSIPTNFPKGVFVLLPKGFYEVQCKEGGHLFEVQKESASQQVLWIPQGPVWRLRDSKKRILEERQCGSCFFASRRTGNWLEEDVYHGKGRLEFTFIIQTIGEDTVDLTGELQRTHPEEDNLFEVGVSGNISKISDFWRYIIGKNIYHPLRFVKGRCQAQETALLIYEAADYLWRVTHKNIYRLIKLKTAYSVLLSLDSESKWVHGAWSDDMETHTRFQADGITLLLRHYQETRERMFLQKAYEASKWLVKINEKTKDGIWFLHDTLEMEGLGPCSKSPYGSNPFGKSRYNSMIMNTHINSIISLLTLLEYKDDDEIRESVEKGLKALRCALEIRSKRKDTYVFTLAWNLRWHCPPVLSRRLWGMTFDLLFRRILIPLVKKKDPAFILPNGFSLRGLANHEGYTYHMVNLYDLARLYSLKREEYFLPALQRMMSFSIQEQYVRYYCFQNDMNKVYLPEAFYIYWAITGEFDENLIRTISESFAKSRGGMSSRTLKLLEMVKRKDMENRSVKLHNSLAGDL